MRGGEEGEEERARGGEGRGEGRGGEGRGEEKGGEEGGEEGIQGKCKEKERDMRQCTLCFTH